MFRISAYILAAVLMTGGSLSARPPGGGHGGGRGGGYSGSYRGGSYSHDGSYNHGGYYNHGYNRSGFSIGVFPGYGYRSYSPYGGGYGYGSYYSTPSYYSEPYYSSEPYYVEPPVVANQYEPPTVVVPGAEEAAEPPASSETKIQIMVPDPSARVWVDGLSMSSTGPSRVIGFPDEQPGTVYAHKLVATWMRDGRQVKEEREVKIVGGKTTTVDFTRPATRPSQAQPSQSQPSTMPPVPLEENP
jgi:uncharacterized protein (TIGR03000 family)